MEDRASWLLGSDDDVLFAHGGCHVFAIALREFSGLPLLWVHENLGTHDHLACDLGEKRLIDFFGSFSYKEYVDCEFLGGREIKFDTIDEKKVKKRFISVRGPGYYIHPDFLVPAMQRARAWIAKHREYFDGTNKIAIPGLCRVKRSTSNE